MIYAILGLLVLCLIFLSLYLGEISRTKKQKDKAERLERLNYGLEKELQKVTGIQKIQEENEKDAEEKINNILNSDDPLATAINGLCKHKD